MLVSIKGRKSPLYLWGKAEKPSMLTEQQPPQIRSPAMENVESASRSLSDRIVIGRPGQYVKDDNRLKGIKI